MYSRVKKSKFKKVVKSQFLVLPFFVGFATLFTGESVNTEAHIKKSESVLAQAAVVQPKNTDQTQAQPAAAPENSQPVAEQVSSAETVTEVAAPDDTAAVQNTAIAANAAYSNTTYASQQAQAANAVSNGNLANGNTAGATGSEAAAQMAAATGVPQSTWEYIIARESNGQVNATNGSGASGLFQTMPGWGSTATVQDQINSAINAYNSQGLSAWGM
ncbi:transglycosylase SLT domain-containing protein [Streptococcus caviae]|uniref:transglycosylase SLT domain-containing protein n=1 Tax=Streptococcus sp. 'caviae' TaxID=1915004 RepID=UPI00094B81F2|nr:transglycosylase SLT domain-containing protein [Streptococcus sp. 'caviae']OLN82427.1 transglycosylase [Streptococcus sp. 'caviae']